MIRIDKSVPVVGRYDVVVCGGGPSGFVSAVAAARMGVSVAIIERYGFFGGMATAGLVAPITEYMHDGELIAGGIPLEFAKRLEELGGGKMCAPRGNFVFHPEIYKVVAQRMLLEEGVKLYLHSYITDCMVEEKDGERKITHVIFDNKDGTKAIEAKCVIDATGDGDIAYKANVPMQNYNAPLQPATLYFVLGGVDTDKIAGYYPHEKGSSIKHVKEKLAALSKTQSIPKFGGPWCFAGVGEGTAVVNMSRTAVDWIDPDSAASGECSLREDVLKLVALLREHFDEFKNCFLISTATQIGIRETRHIKGVHVLTGEEYKNAVKFHDSVARCSHPIDIHSATDHTQVCTYLDRAAYLPYRSIIADGFPNLLVPSRCFSADREAFASARVQVGVMGLGQAAGVAAAICSRNDQSVISVNTDDIRSILLSWGAVI